MQSKSAQKLCPLDTKTGKVQGLLKLCYLTYMSSPDDVALDLCFAPFCVVSLLGVVARLCVFVRVEKEVAKEVARGSTDICLTCTDDKAIALTVETNCVVLLDFSISVVGVPKLWIKEDSINKFRIWFNVE